MPSIATSIIGGVTGMGSATRAGDTSAGGYDAAGKKIDAATGQAITYGQQGNADVNAGRDNANTAVGTARDTANTTLRGVYDTALGNAKPYQAVGTEGAGLLASGMAAGGDLSKTFDASQMEANDPGYQFRLQQGQQALDRSAAARGNVMGGGQMKAMQTYAQGQASSEYQNAFNRFTTTQQNRIKNLGDMAGIGQQANAQSIVAGDAFGSGTSQNTMNAAGLTSGNDMAAGARTQQGDQWMGQTGMTGAEVSGQDSIGSANAHANGIMARQQAMNGMLGGIGQGLNSALTGGFGGGGGFSMAGAASGVPQWGRGGGSDVGGTAASGAWTQPNDASLMSLYNGAYGNG